MTTLWAEDEIGYWRGVPDGDPRAFDLFSRHYSYQDYADGRRQLHGYRNRFLIMGPGEKLVLLGSDERALFGWRRFRDASGQTGINCSVFRNESGREGVELLLEAELVALRRWPDVARLYTYVDANMVRGNPPGAVFVRAGWRVVGRTKDRGLLILAKDVTRAMRAAAVLMP